MSCPVHLPEQLFWARSIWISMYWIDQDAEWGSMPGINLLSYIVLPHMLQGPPDIASVPAFHRGFALATR
jgi:hypothetical protein